MLELAIIKAFVKEASAQLSDQDTPPDYYETRTRFAQRFGHVKQAWDWHGFKEGLVDEGIPLGGATLGAALGAKYMKSPLRGAALGYAAGGGASLLRSKMMGEEPSATRKLLAAGALGYGAGGLSHWGLEHLTHRGAAAARAAGKPMSRVQSLFHGPEHGFAKNLVEEALPAGGATLGTAVAMGSEKKPKKPVAPVLKQR